MIPGIPAYIAELLGTYFFILVIIASGGSAIISGAALALVIVLVGGISSAFLNPAVSIAMFIQGSLTTVDLIAYIGAQMLGGLAAIMTYRLIKD
jgi:aquaporin Z